jgi:RHS repeat-associated protein
VAATLGISAGISSDGSAGGRTPGAEPWQEWAQQPVRAPLVLVATAKAEAGTQLTIGLAGHNWLFGYQNPEVVRSGAGSDERVQANDSAPQSVQIEVVATQQGNSVSDSGRLLVPKATQNFTYDFDGSPREIIREHNVHSADPVRRSTRVLRAAGVSHGEILTFDDIWQYEWDLACEIKTSPRQQSNGNRVRALLSTIRAALDYLTGRENRLKAVTMTNVVGVPNAQRFRLELGYDWLGRRLAKTVKTWTGPEFANPVTTRFVYDGWRLLAELDADNSVVRSYTWGLDLSGTLDDAGGIGGLLFVTQHPGLTMHFGCHDANGNVVALVDTAGTVTARYEYGPFGEPIGLRGAFAETNPIRWSTKYTDCETELVYYGSRHYSPTLGRWISRDPIEEEGANNLYAFAANNAINAFDALGMTTGTALDTEGSVAIGQGMSSSGAGQAITITQHIQNGLDTFNDIQEFLAAAGEGPEGMLIVGLQIAADRLGSL